MDQLQRMLSLSESVEGLWPFMGEIITMVQVHLSKVNQRRIHDLNMDLSERLVKYVVLSTHTPPLPLLTPSFSMSEVR